MSPRWCKILSLAVIIPYLLFTSPRRAAALTRVSGNYYLEETRISGPEGSADLLAGGINFVIEPQTTKRLHLRLSVPFRFEIADGERSTKTSPIGNFAADIAGEWFTLNLQRGEYVTLSSSAQRTESTFSTEAYSLAVPDLPRLAVNHSKTETTSGTVSSEVEGLSVFSDYRYKGMNFRAGHVGSTVTTGDSAPVRYSSLLLGMGGSYELAPRTVLSFDDDFNRYVQGRSGSDGSMSTTNNFRMSAVSRPYEWLGLGGNLFRSAVHSESGSTDQQSRELSVTLYPRRSLSLTTLAGNRSFTEAGTQRRVDYWTVGAAFSDRVIETILLGLNATRTYESDPSQGRNISDNYSVNALMNIAPGISATAVLGVSRQENRQFVSTKTYDAAGTLAERAQYDDRPAGFTFFDIVNNDLYTKNSPAPGDWSLPVHIEPVTKQYGVTKNLQVIMIPTDKTNLTLSYSSTFSSEKLDLTGAGSQSLRGSLTYLPNRRTSYSIFETVNLSESGSRAYATSANMSYRFFKGHLMNLNYTRQESGGKVVETFSGTLGLTIARRTSMQIVYVLSQPGKEDETYFLKAGISRSF